MVTAVEAVELEAGREWRAMDHHQSPRVTGLNMAGEGRGMVGGLVMVKWWCRMEN